MDGFRALLAALATTGLTLAPGVAEAQGASFIEGVITDEATGQPLVDWATVELYDESGAFVTQITEATDSEGRYRIGPVPGGTYRLRFLDARLAGYTTEWWEDEPDFASADPVTVLDGETLAGIDFSVGQPAPPVTVGYIEGTITDAATGGPVPEGFPVGLGLFNLDGTHCAYPDGTSCGTYAEPGPTDVAGHYRFGPVPPGTYKVQLVDFAWFTYTGLGCPCTNIDGQAAVFASWWEDRADFASADPVTIVDGETTILDFALRPSNVPLPGQPIVEGRIIDAATGEPLADWVGVAAYDEAGNVAAVQQNPTDADGRYELWLSAGTYRLEFRDARLAGYAPEWWEDKADFASADPVVVPQTGTVGPYDFRVAIPGSLGGWISGVVVDRASGDPLPSINYLVYDLDGNLVASNRTDGSGAFRTPALGSGSFKLAFEDSAYFAYWTFWYGGTDFQSATVIEVEELAEVAGIAVSMALKPGAVSPLLPFGGAAVLVPAVLGVASITFGLVLVGIAKPTRERGR